MARHFAVKACGARQSVRGIDSSSGPIFRFLPAPKVFLQVDILGMLALNTFGRGNACRTDHEIIRLPGAAGLSR